VALMKPTLIDRAVAVIAPEAAANRMLARARIEAAEQLPALSPSPGTMTALDPRNAPPEDGTSASGGGWLNRWFRGSVPRSASVDTLPGLSLSRAASRDLVRTSPIAAGAINTNVDRIVGTGLALSAVPVMDVLGWNLEQAMAWKRKTQREFSLWADSPECDMAQKLNFYQQQALVLRGTLESGDIFTLLPDGKATRTQPYRLRIQTIEADRVGNPRNVADSSLIAGGVETDEFGAPLKYHVYDQHPGGYSARAGSSMFAGQWIDRVGSSGRKRLLHHLRVVRPDQPRGLPYLAPIIDSIKQISRYTEAEIMAAVITAYLTVFVTTPTGSASPVFAGDAPAAATSNEVGLGMGAMVGLAPGETVEVVNPLRPNPNFGSFINAVLVQVGMALSLPFELLIKQFNSSYTASRAALLDAAVYFRNTRSWLSLSYCQPIYEMWMTEAVITGRIEAPGYFGDPLLRWAYSRAAWPGDSMGSLNPKDEVAAYVAAIEARVMTRERAEWELFGTDWHDTFDAKKSEQDRLREANLLPVPKAGAAAPAEETPPIDPPKETP
jgi:lambda family phage portal protein